jgi:hypothetical protein
MEQGDSRVVEFVFAVEQWLTASLVRALVSIEAEEAIVEVA